MQISKSYHIFYSFSCMLQIYFSCSASPSVPLPGVSLLLSITSLVSTLGWMLRKLDVTKKIPENVTEL